MSGHEQDNWRPAFVSSHASEPRPNVVCQAATIYEKRWVGALAYRRMGGDVIDDD
jgi:hypothetical protein